MQPRLNWMNLKCKTYSMNMKNGVKRGYRKMNFIRRRGQLGYKGNTSKYHVQS